MFGFSCACARVAPLALFLAAVVGTSALAEVAPPPTPTPAPIGHVVTSDRQDEPAALSARTTYVVDKAEMIRHGWITVGDAIETVPGVDLIRYGALGAQISAQIRGAASSQVLVLIDGRPVAGSQLGGVDLAAMTTVGIDRIEVVEGPGATLYGSGAVGGVINVITASGRAAAHHTDVTVGGGSYGARDFSVESRSFAFESVGADNGYRYALPDGTAATRVNADDREVHGSANLQAQLGALDTVVTLQTSDRHVGVPGPIGFLTAGERQNDGTSTALVTFAQHGARSTTSLDLDATRERITALDADPADATTSGAFDATSLEARTHVSLRNVVGTTARLVYGLDLARESVVNDDGVGDRSVDALAQSALYVQDSIPVGSMSRVYAGLRGENDAGFGTALSPSIGAVIGISDAFALRVNGANAFRAPTAAELYFPNFGNPALRPERTSGGDVALVASRVLGGASLGWFVQNGRDLIAYDAAANTDTNVARSSVAGFIFSIATLPREGVTARFNLTDTYRALDLTAQATRLTYRPVIVSNLDVSYAPTRGGPIDAIGFVVHSEGLRDPAGAFAFTRFDGYARVRIAPHALLSVRGSNLANEPYQPVAGYPAAGRAFGIAVSTR